MDLRKAFVFASFDAIYLALHHFGVPHPFIDYIQFIYIYVPIFLFYDGIFCRSLSPKRSVRQGDHLWSTLFLIMFDFILRALPDRLGAVLRMSVRICCIAYTDDLLLLDRDAICNQDLLNIIFYLLLTTGLCINGEKSFTFSWIASTRLKNVIYDFDARFYVGCFPFGHSLSTKVLHIWESLTPDCRIFKPPPFGSNLRRLQSAYL